MYLLGEQPAYADAWVNRLQGLAAQMLHGVAPLDEAIELEQCADLSPHIDETCLYLIDSGLLHARVNERPLFYLQEGDLVGLQQAHSLPCAYHYSCEGPLRLVPYSRSEVLAHLNQSTPAQELLVEYLTGHTTLLCDAITRLKQPEFRSSNGFKHVAAGETLINQGDNADHVFVIIEGHAEAFVDGHKVGDVPKDEIFGAMAVFTAEKRSATVIASEPCTIMLIPKEQFLNLTQTNPRIAHSLIESMARRIDSLNRQVTRLISAN
ncbi:MAG: cyclic nucleotide-binding domain-containing protein [Pseudomonas sp.]|uniref:Crp/Fnr family transcriptional regulator n=1 Tax=Pseudomonas abieticivorans TaxID=2931382 RepID=UPI0020BD539D|nr:cyclic nucleotide-binding domain-containing protein [Pseudomonas sp. PIA16]MDE1164469.1 cyclic nucleotide-binding domain-containing protein [Pseudomonas sp.]